MKERGLLIHMYAIDMYASVSETHTHSRVENKLGLVGGGNKD